MSHSIDELVIKITSESDGASEKLNALADSISRLIDPTSMAVTNLRALSNALSSINRNTNKFPDNITSVANSIATLGDKVDASGDSIKSLADNMGDLAMNTNDAKTDMKELAESTDNLIKSSEKASKITNSTNAFKGVGRFISSAILAGGIAGAINSANEYIEAQNLFRVSMDTSYKAAQEWSSKVSKALGIDPAEMEKNMGYFQQLSSAMGITTDRAYILSKNLTSLAYDISSFYNIKIDQSFLKLQSALVGELEPIRRLGMDISKTRLQQELYTLGIRASVDSLTQADKAILRYIALMKQTKNAQADMGKTLMSPANALRVLKSQFIQLARAIGYIFIPILQSLVPVLQVITRLLTNLAERLARFLGFEDFDFGDEGSKIASDLLGIGDAAEKAGKKIKYFTTSFDELHVINDSVTGDGEGVNLLGDIELPEYDILEKYTGNIINEVLPKLERAFEEFVQSPAIQLLIISLKTIYDIIKNIAQYLLDNPDILADFLVLESVLLIVGGIGGIINKIKLLNKALTTTELTIGAIKLNLLQVFGAVMLLTSAYNTLKYATVEALTTGDERIEASKKSLLNFGLVVVGLGLLISSGAVVVLGVIVAAAASFFDEIMLYLATFIHNLDVFINEKIIAGVLKGISWLAIEVTRKLWELGWWIESNVDKLLAKIKRPLLKLGEWIVEKTNFILEPLFKIWDNIFGTDLTYLLKNTDKVFANEYKKLDEVEDKWQELYDEKMKYFDDVKDATMTTIDDVAKDTTKFSAEVQWKAANKVAEKYNKEDSEDTNDNGILANLFGESSKMLEEQTSELIIKQDTANKLTQETQDLLNTANVTSMDNLHIAQQSLDTVTSNTTTTHNLLERILAKIGDVVRAVENVKINIINYYGGGEYASGGLPRKGELFLANEAGPEFIGSIGGRSAVANSTQMVEALASGVYDGMTAAMRNNTSTRPINVPVQVLMPNGRELARATAQGSIDNGYNIGLEGYDV